MNYATQGIIEALKSAREAKGLSQRALSARTGVPQGHVSKIENGGADIRLSSLTELARALDLELKLVPRKAVPAVDQVISSTRGPATPALKELNRTLDAVKNLRVALPNIEALSSLQRSFREFENLRNVGLELGSLRAIAKPIRELENLAKRAGKSATAMEIPEEQLIALQQAASTAQVLRNSLAVLEEPSPPRPAYRLDDEEDDRHG